LVKLMSSSESEPDWVVSQSSAQKAQAQQSRLSDSPSWADELSDPELNEDAPEDNAGGTAPAEQKKTGGEKKRKSAPSSRLPLVLAPKVRRDMILVEADDPSIDLSGDFGCIGRMHLRKAGKAAAARSSSEEPTGVAEVTRTVMVDLKGKLYDGDILPCNSVCLLAIDGSKARVDAVFSDFVKLDAPRDSIFDNEAVQEGEFGTDFFADDADNYNSGASDSEELGPLREHRGGGKSKAKGKGSKGKGSKGKGSAASKGGGTKGGAKKAPSAGVKRSGAPSGEPPKKRAKGA